MTDGERTVLDPERARLQEMHEYDVPWQRWGPYLSERQWGTVREDYSATGDAWDSFPYDMALYRAYRWGEDGMLGISDRHCTLCFSLALWNGQDPFIKERFFGLSNPQGNHGEDVKEYYFYQSNTPTHSSMRALYKYPQRAFPYADLLETNAKRPRTEPEYELLDTGIFDEERYFDVAVEYAKAGPEDIVVRIDVTNRGPEAATLDLLPTLWFRNTWSWGWDDRKPSIVDVPAGADVRTLRADHWKLGTHWLVAEGSPDLLVTQNETDNLRLWNVPNESPYVKDGINRAVVDGDTTAVNPKNEGTKASLRYRMTVPPGETRSVSLRLAAGDAPPVLDGAAEVLTTREAEADAFYAALQGGMIEEECSVFRQALAGLLWTKQYYEYDVPVWLQGDPAQPKPPPQRWSGRNVDWQTLRADDILLMPDAWEYPWFAAWDLAFHCVTMALIDPGFAKHQLLLLMREWYMRPDGQIPAYEWSFGDVNPPVYAWAALRIYEIEKTETGTGDRFFLERVFHKLLVNFTWWVNRKDPAGHNVFEAGFLGLDNIGVFNRDAPLPTGGILQQADATAWVAMLCLNMLAIALDLATEDPVYEDIATKFFEHFLYIASAMNTEDGGGSGLWDAEDQFYYDSIQLDDGRTIPLKVRSLVGLIPLCAVMTIDPELLAKLPSFRGRLQWFLEHRPDMSDLVSAWEVHGEGHLYLLALSRGTSMKAILSRMLDPTEFLSDYGIRSLSKVHLEHPYTFDVGGTTYEVQYEPGPSSSPTFGGNSNWRGPIWFPTNYLLIDALRRYFEYYSDDFFVEYPHGSGQLCTLQEIAHDLSVRLTEIFLPPFGGVRPVYRDQPTLATDPHWCENVLFYEYFHGDTAAGIGASHQTGWTALVANLLREIASRSAERRLPPFSRDATQ
jgi:hypothetical protein